MLFEEFQLAKSVLDVSEDSGLVDVIRRLVQVAVVRS